MDEWKEALKKLLRDNDVKLADAMEFIVGCVSQDEISDKLVFEIKMCLVEKPIGSLAATLYDTLKTFRPWRDIPV